MASIHFLNVKEGDCSIIQHENGHVTMIDVSNAFIPQVEDAESAEVIEKAFAVEALKGNYNQKANPTNPIEYLNTIGVTEIFRYIQTHPDMDHMDGLAALRRRFQIYNFWDTKNNKQIEWHAPFEGGYKKEDWDCYQQLRVSTANPKSLFFEDGACEKYFAKDEHDNLKQDDYLEILSPTSQLITSANNNGEWNDSSYVILYHIHGKKVLFCGDAGDRTIAHLLELHSEAIKNIDVLIAPHHGRDSDKDFGFLDIMKPKITLFGNADSKDMAYQPWIDRKLIKFTNNQIGDAVLEVSLNKFAIYVSNKSFVDEFRSKNKFQETQPHVLLNGMWLLWKIQ